MMPITKLYVLQNKIGVSTMLYNQSWSNNMKANLSALEHFNQKLNEYKSEKARNDAANEVANYGRQIAEAKYLGSKSRIVVSTTPAMNGRSQVVAQGEQIAYMEFGTGIKGENSKYPGKLPTERIEFISRGGKQATQGWQYDYYKKQHPDENIGSWTGIESQKQMYYTSVELKEKFKMGGKG